jgi:hypothetical protein
MNLWAKSLRQLAMLTVALFFFSCEDENSILGFKNPNKKFNVSYIEIPLESSVMLIDSIVTDNFDERGVSLLGQYQDNAVGNLKATTFVQTYPASSTVLPGDAVFDSVTIQLNLNFYSYGFTGESEEKFSIYEVKVPALNTNRRVNYFYNTELKQEPFLIGQGAITVKYDTLRKYDTLAANKRDTLLITTKLSDVYGLELFNAAKTTAAGFDQFDRFKYEFRGLKIVPTQSQAILGIDLGVNSSGPLSKVIVHYHTPSATKQTKVYNIGLASFTNIQADRSGTELDGVALYQPFEPASGLRYVQSGAGVVTRIDLKNFYDFADALDKVVINSAELVISNTDSPEGKHAHSALGFRVLATNNLFMNNTKTVDSAAMSGYNTLRDGRYYLVNSDISSSQQAVPASIVYDDNTYSGFMTFFMQSVFNKRKDENGIRPDRIQYLALYPLRPMATSSVTRTVFHKDNIKLRIYYTQPTQEN